MQTKHIINILVVVIVAVAFLTLSTTSTSSSEGWYPSPDPCVPMTESCYKKIWSNAGCTTDPTKLPGQLHWALKQRGSDLEIDANKWATSKDSTHVKGCYGAFPKPSDYVKPAIVPLSSV